MTIKVYTMQEALDEYNMLLEAGGDFPLEWKNTKKDFEEWCSLYDIMIGEVA